MLRAGRGVRHDRSRAHLRVRLHRSVTSIAAHAAIQPLAARELRRVVVVLCATEIVSWGVLFYAFPVLVTTISANEGWPLSSMIALFTVAQLVAAASGVAVGRHIDRHGPRRVMTGGSLLAVVGVVALAASPSLPVLGAAWVVVGVAMSATLYPPAFAAVTHWGGSGRVKALTAITLVGGLASTVFAPLTALLVSQLGWRQTYLVLALVLCATIPAHWWGLGHPWLVAPYHDAGSADVGTDGGRRSAVVRRSEFVQLAAALTLGGFCIYAVVVNLVPLLVENGLTTGEAAVALGIGGAGQVAGRLVYGPVLTAIGVRKRTIVVLLAASLTTVALATVRDPLAMVVTVSFAAGTARGVFTLIQATAVTDRWGTAGYGARSSVLSGSVHAAAAFAPWACAATAALLHSYSAAFVLLAGLAALAALLVPAVRPGTTGQPKRPEM